MKLILDFGSKLYVNSLQIYLQEVLGIQSFIPTMVQESVSAQTTEKSHRLVIFLDEEKWTEAELDLFEKMRSAMKLSSADSRVIFLSAEQVSEREIEFLAADYIVSFSAEVTKGLAKTHDQVPSITTVSPRTLIKNPGQKKQAWEDLKLVMGHLGLH